MFNNFLGDKQLFAGKCAPVINQSNMDTAMVKHCWVPLIYCTVNEVSSYPISSNFPILEHSLTELREKHNKEIILLLYL